MKIFNFSFLIIEPAGTSPRRELIKKYLRGFKMVEQTSFNWEAETAVNEGDERTFVEFDENGETIVKFEENEPFYAGIPVGDKYNTKKYMFRVEKAADFGYEKAIFSTGSKRCLVALKNIRPLANKTVLIKRAGEGYDTQYTAEVL